MIVVKTFVSADTLDSVKFDFNSVDFLSLTAPRHLRIIYNFEGTTSGLTHLTEYF